MRRRVLFLLLILLVSPAPARPGDGQGLVLLARADLKLKRLLVAQALGDFSLALQELDDAKTLLQEMRDWVDDRPAWNTPQTRAALDNTEELLRFSRLRIKLMADLEPDIEQQVQHFLAQDYPPAQKVSLLILAARAASRRYQLDVAERLLRQAAETDRTNLSAPARYALATEVCRLKQLRGAPPSLEDFRRSFSLLSGYQPKLHPLHDIDWLLARDSTDFWVGTLKNAGEPGQRELQRMGAFFQTTGQGLKNEYDQQTLKAQGITFPYDGYLKLFANTVLLSSNTDQLLMVWEAESRSHSAVTTKNLLDLENLLAQLPSTAKLFTNPKLGVGYQQFDIGRRGLVAELAGRSKLLRARLEQSSSRNSLIQEGLDLLRQSQDTRVLASHLLQVGEELKESEPEEAARLWSEALSVSTDHGLAEETLKARARLTRQALARQQWNDCRRHSQAALREIEQLVPTVGPDSEAALKLASLARFFSSALAEASVAQENVTEALTALTLGHQLESAAARVGAQKEAARELEGVARKKRQLEDVALHLAELKQMPASSTRDDLIEESQKLLADTRSEFLATSREIRQKHSKLYSSVLRFDPLNLPGVQQNLPADTAVLQYFPTEKELFLFLVTRETLRLRSVKVKKIELQRTAGQLIRLLSRMGPLDQTRETSRQLHRHLIAPVEDDLHQIGRLVLIPAGSLNLVPFACLYDEQGTPLLERYALLHLAKPTDFVDIAARRPIPIDRVATFANATEDLPAAAAEGKAIAAIFEGSPLFLGREATRRTLLEQGGQAPALHLATHGQWDPHNPLNSYLQMADEPLSQEQIFSLTLNDTSLVTLSCCDTAVADSRDVDYLASLAEAFWLAGSRSVIASLWAVDDAGTGLIMQDFYRGLKSGKDKARALREAQLSLASQPEFEHPGFWAAFILFGDWR